MAGKSRQTFNKVNIERAKREKREEKLQKKRARQEDARNRRDGETAGEESGGA